MLMKLTPGDELPLTLGRTVEPKGGLAMLTEAGKKVDDAIVRWIGEALDPRTYASLGVTEADLKHEAAPKQNVTSEFETRRLFMLGEKVRVQTSMAIENGVVTTSDPLFFSVRYTDDRIGCVFYKDIDAGRIKAERVSHEDVDWDTWGGTAGLDNIAEQRERNERARAMLDAAEPLTIGVDYSAQPDKTIMFRRWTPKQFVIVDPRKLPPQAYDGRVRGTHVMASGDRLVWGPLGNLCEVSHFAASGGLLSHTIIPPDQAQAFDGVVISNDTIPF